MRPSSLLVAIFSVFALTGIVDAQRVGQPSYANDPNIIVPESTRRPAHEIPGKFAYTNHLIYIGPWNFRNADEPPILPLHGGGGPFFTGGPGGYHPADLQAAYGIPGGLGTGAIAVVDAYNLPTALNDFNVYASEFGLPTETSTNATSSTNKVFQVVYASGSVPANNAGWGQEEALDMEVSHAMASHAKIYLVEAASNSFADLLAAVQTASTLPGVSEVSMSWGGGEFSGENTYDTNFATSGVTYFAATGDSSSDNNYPAISTSVIAVGGTSLYMSGGTVTSESAWADSGGGISAYYTRPGYQNGVSSVVGSMRGSPDVAAVGDPNTGVAMYDSTADGPYVDWYVIGGTSVATPLWAGVTNARGQFSASTNAELTRQYGYLGMNEFRDITTGSAGSRSAKAGYDLATGLGVPNGLLPSSGTMTFNVTNVAPYYSTLVGGNAASLDAIDGNDYTIGSEVNSSGWAIAGLSATFSVVFPGGAAVSTASISVYATDPTASEVQLYALNTGTGNYDFISESQISGGTGPLSFNLPSISKYISSTGKLSIILRSADPIVGGVTPPPFNFAVDLLQVTATPVGSSAYNATSVSPYYSTLVSGTLSSLFAIDSNDYTVATSENASKWQIAGLSAGFTVVLPGGAAISSASVSIYGTEPTGAEVQIYALNIGTNSYDYLTEAPLSGATGSLNFTLPNLSKYFTSAGKISIIVRSVELPVGGVAQPAYNFGVDLLQINAH